MKHTIFAILAIVVLLTSMSVSAEGSDNRIIGINVLLNTEITKDILAELGTYGTVCGVIGEIKAVIQSALTTNTQTQERKPAAAPAKAKKTRR